MSFEATSRVLRAEYKSPRHKLVMLGIASHADADGNNAWPTHATLALYASATERTVIRLLAELEQDGMLVIERHGGGTLRRTVEGRRPNLYSITAKGMDGNVTQLEPELGDIPSELGDIGDELGDMTPRVACDDAMGKSSPESPVESPRPVSPHGFDEFWETYPRKVGKPAALRAFKAAAKGPRERTEAILDGLVTWCQAWKRAGTAAAFIPHPATWLNQHRWNDTPDLDTAAATSGLATAVIEAAEPFFVEHHGDWFRHVQQPTFSAMIELMKRWGFDYSETMIRVAIQLRRNPAKALDPVTLRNINEVERFEGFPTTYDLPESMRRAASLGHWKAAW